MENIFCNFLRSDSDANAAAKVFDDNSNMPSCTGGYMPKIMETVRHCTQ